jgi:hypothetical protein
MEGDFIQNMDKQFTDYLAGSDLHEFLPFKCNSGSRKLGKMENELKWITKPKNEFTKMFVFTEN